jgi:hypothetical protein
MCNRTSSQETTSCLWLVTKVSSGDGNALGRPRKAEIPCNQPCGSAKGFVTDGLFRPLQFLFDHRHHASLDRHHP